MSLVFNFNIEELPDGASFIFTDLTGDYSALNTSGWGAPNIEKSAIKEAVLVFKKLIREVPETITYASYTINLTNFPVTSWSDGIELVCNTESAIFEDGAYEVTLTLSGSTFTDIVVIKNFGFYALIKDDIMNQLMTYDPFLPKRTKELYWEKTRLLDNMFYATQTDQILQFEENLEALTRLL